MSLLTALGMYMGANAKAKRQNALDADAHTYQQSQIDEAKQADVDRKAQIDQTTAYNTADLAQRQKALEATNRRDGLDANGNPVPLPGYATPAPLPIGTKGAPPTPDQMVRYYSEQARVANDNYAKTGDPRWDAIAKNANGQAATYASALLNVNRGTEITTAKIPLEQAQTQYWKERIPLLRDTLKQQAQIAQQRFGVQYAGIAQRAATAASEIRSRADLAKEGVDSREAIAVMTQIGMLNNKSQAQAFQEALQQQRQGQAAANTKWINDSKLAAAGTPPAGYNPAGPQQISLTVPAAAPAAPSIVNVQVTLPNGQKVSVPVPGNPNANKGGAVGVPPIRPPAAVEVANARKATNPKTGKPYTDEEIRATMKAHQYTEAEINAALAPPQRHSIPVWPGHSIPLPF